MLSRNELNTVALKNERILVIDDEETILFAIRDYFNFYGYDVDCARNRAEADKLLHHLPYSVIITDLCLTGFDEREGLGMIRDITQKFPFARIVVLTAYASPKAEKEARRLDVKAFLSKPQPLQQLVRIVHEIAQPRPD